MDGRAVSSGGAGQRLARRGLGRRRFLQGSAALASVSLLAGCASLPRAPWLAKPTPRVGLLSLNNSAVKDWVAAWDRRFAEIGHVDGQNVVVERRVAPKNENMDELAKELVALKVDAIMAIGWMAAKAAKDATASIPIVSVTSDPVTSTPPLVDSFARPGGNVTGLTTMSVRLAQKRVEVFRDAIPGLQNTAIIYNDKIPDRRTELGETKKAAESLGLEVLPLPVNSADDYEEAFATAAAKQTHGMFLLFDQMTFPGQSHPAAGVVDPVAEPLAQSMVQYRMPAVCDIMDWAENAGGLMTYGPDFNGLFRRAAEMVDKVMGGAKPADLPIEQPGRFGLSVNLTVARSIGLTVPDKVLKEADRLFQ